MHISGSLARSSHTYSRAHRDRDREGVLSLSLSAMARAAAPLLPFFFLLLSSTSPAANGQKNRLGLTPQMGWNSWNHFGCKIDEATIQKIGKTGTPLFSLSLENQTKNKTYCVYVADAMVDTGLAKLGYEYINLGNRFAFLAFFGFPLFQLFMFRNEACNIHSGYVCSETADDCWAAYNRDSQVTSTTTC